MKKNILELELLFESAVNGYALIDEKMNLILFNRKMEKFLQSISGVKIQENKSILGSIPEFFKTDFLNSAQKAFKGESLIDEKRFSDDLCFKISYSPNFQMDDTVKTVLISIVDTSPEWQMMRLASENAQLMGSVFETGSGIALVCSDGRIEKCNNVFCEIVGYTKEELLTINYFDLVAQSDKALSKKRISACFSSQKAVASEVNVLHKSGKLVIILEQLTFLKDDDFTPLIIISIADITEKKHAEKELKAREMFYKALIERSADMKILTDEEGKIKFISPAVTKFLGYLPEDLQDRYVSDYVPMEDMPRLVVLINEVMSESGASVITQQRIRHKDGKWRHCEGTITNLLHNPNVVSLVANFRDITEKRKASELLKTSEASLRAIFNSVDQGFVLLDINAKIMLFNVVADEWSVFTFNKRLEKGSNFLHYVSKESVSKFSANFSGVLEKNIYNAEVSYKVFNGQVLWFHVRMSPVLNEFEDVTGVCITATNITVRKNTEFDKERITQDLIKRNKDLQQFTYIVSHNLRAPTANIMALTDMLQNFRNLTNADKKFILEGLSTSSRNLDMVIRDLNQILQIDNAIGEKREQIQFVTILQELMLSISHLVKAEKAQISADFSAAPDICTIRLYLYSIFYNIISNSLKYRNPGSPLRIKISSMKNEHGVQLYFSDNGLGIDLSTQGDKIFGLYNRFHLHKEGKGMGLFMVKAQVEALGGTIHVESELGQGTKFMINLKNEPIST
jgi:PAS domain S-box-containing protein